MRSQPGMPVDRRQIARAATLVRNRPLRADA
jgi:hypothetical protein